MSRSQRWMELLHAYHDGELSRLARWRVERRLLRDPSALRELEGLRTLASALQELDAGAETPDLWESVRPRLVAVDARRDASDAVAPGFWERLGAAPRLVGTALAGAALALALVISANLRAPVEPCAVRWLDSRGSPVMVLQDDQEATIIWILEGPEGETLSWRSDLVVA